MKFRGKNYDLELIKAIDLIVSVLERSAIRRITSDNSNTEIERIRLAIATRHDWDLDTVFKVADQIQQLLEAKEIW